MSFRLRKGKNHAKWQPVSTFVYKNSPQINIDQNVCTVCGTCVDICPKKIYEISSEDTLVRKKMLDCTLCKMCISGETDYIVEEAQVVQVKNGHPMMPRVTGLGCTASALCGAFIAVNPSASAASAHAMAIMGVAGELAAEQAKGPGSLQMHFLDALHNLTETDITERVKLELSS